MILVISNETAWNAACKKYDINWTPTPAAWPVLVSFEPGNEEDAALNVAVITPEQAAKFLSICPATRLLQVDANTRSKVVGAMAVGGLPEATPILFAQTQNTLKAYSAIDAAGNVHTISGFPSSVSFKVGDKIQFNGNVYTITAAASTIPALDPVTGTEGMVTFMNEENKEQLPDSKIPGLEEIPMDPGKMITKDKIADLGDEEEHVLDDERDI